MFLNKFFPNRIKTLRTAHKLSLSLLASVLGKKKSAITEIESGRSGTTLDSIVDFCSLFCVSADWLLGLSETPYNMEVISHIEKNLLNRIEESMNSSDTEDDITKCYQVYSWLLTNEIYSNRDKILSLPVRANIVFCIKMSLYDCLDVTKKANILDMHNRVKIIKQYLYKQNDCLKPDCPVFDITKPPEE